MQVFYTDNCQVVYVANLQDLDVQEESSTRLGLLALASLSLLVLRENAVIEGNRGKIFDPDPTIDCQSQPNSTKVCVSSTVNKSHALLRLDNVLAGLLDEAIDALFACKVKRLAVLQV